MIYAQTLKHLEKCYSLSPFIEKNIGNSLSELIFISVVLRLEPSCFMCFNNFLV